MENISAADIFIFVVIGLSALLSLGRGFVSEMLGIGSWFLATVIGFYAMPILSPRIEPIVHKPLLANILSIASASLVALVVLTVICSRITVKVRKSVLNRLDHFLGFIFGCLRGIVILVLLYFIIMIIAPKSLPDFRKDSRLMPYLEMVTENVRDQLPESLFDNPVKNEDGEEEEPSDLDELIQKLNETPEKAKKDIRSKPKTTPKNKEIEILPEDDPLRRSLEELESEVPRDPSEKEFFDLLNSPQVKAKPSRGSNEGYDRKEREDLNRLILESVDDVESAVP